MARPDPLTHRLPRPGKWVRLRAVLPDDVDFLYELYTAPRIAYRATMADSFGSFESFSSGWRRQKWIQALVVSQRDGSPVGHALAQEQMARSQSAFVGIAMAPSALGFGKGIEAVLLFADYLFAAYGFRKLYAQSPDYSFRKLAMGEGTVFRTEGQLRDHHYYNGDYFDSNIMAVTREEWLRLREDPSFGRGWRALLPRRKGDDVEAPRHRSRLGVS